MYRPSEKPISLTLGFTEPPPQNAAARLAEWGGIRKFLENTVLLDDFTDERSWRSIVRICREHHLQGSVRYVHFANQNWPNLKKPDPGWVGLIMSPGKLQPAPCNPPQDFDLILPGPCKGALREGVPIIVADRPHGQLSGAFLENRIISSRLFEAVGGDDMLRVTGSVVHKDRPLPNWVRFAPKEHCRVLADETYGQPVECPRCKMPFVASIGLWLGREMPEAVPEMIAGDELGYAHSRVTHPLVISLEMARRIEDHFRGEGYHLCPIWSYDSATAKRVRTILRDIDDLRKSA
jgi:hypothetical protein